jgi:L-seryl-tRNA(Ser) seleniumtransferase
MRLSSRSLTPDQDEHVDIYEEIGLRSIVNADSRMTALGGSVMLPEVVAAMAAASRHHVDMFALQERVGERIATLTGNEAAFVCTGAAAGIFVSVLACMTGPDPATISRLPGARPARHDVIVHRAHRIPYDPALELAGAGIVEIGNALQTFEWELEAAITESTAAVFFVAGEHLKRGALSLETTVAIAHRHGVPVIVDAAAQLPPRSNLWHLSRDIGADLVVFSGGKDLRGPQSSGFVVGRASLIEACRAHASPHQRLARLAKVGKEEMIGLLTAIACYLEEDEAGRLDVFEGTVQAWVQRLDGIRPDVTVIRDFPNEAGQPIPRARLDLDPATTGLSAFAVQQALLEQDPPVAVAAEYDRYLYLTPDTLEPGEAEIVAASIARCLGEAGTG